MDSKMLSDLTPQPAVKVETPAPTPLSGIVVPVTLRDLSGRTISVQAPSGTPEIMVGVQPGFGAFRFVRTEEVDQNLQRIYQQT